MDIVATVSVIGSVASVAGAIWAWRQSQSASSSANEAKRIKEQIVILTDVSNLSEIKAIYESSQKTVRKYAFRGDKDLAGVDPQQDAEAIYTLLEKVNEMGHLFPPGTIDDVSKKLEAPLQGLVNAQSPAEMKKQGKKIYDELQPLLPIVKRELIKKQNNTR